MAPPVGILHIPHDSVVIPADVRPSLLLSDDALSAELLAMTDAYTAELFVASAPVARIVYPVSRLVVDPERFLSDSDEPMAELGMGAVYTRTSSGAVLRQEPSVADRQALIERFYAPHHSALDTATELALQAHGRCLIIDCHSFPSRPLPYERDQDRDRPMICLGTDAFHTPEDLHQRAADLFIDAGYTVRRDRPFSGSIVPARHYNRTGEVASLMIELNRGLYMNEGDGSRSSGFRSLANTLRAVLDELFTVILLNV